MKQVKTSAEPGRSRHVRVDANPVARDASRDRCGATFGVRGGVAMAIVALAALVLPLGCHRSSGSSGGAVLVINEISPTAPTDPLSPAIIKSTNGATILDETGGPVDWVEVYNPGPGAVSLAGYSLTDNPARPGRYRFPINRLLQAGEFALVLLSGDRTRGPRHGPFRLGSSGETVYLFNGDGRNIVDRKGYVNLEPNASVGRYPDGPANTAYDVIYVPTPGAPNRRIGIKPPRIRRVALLGESKGVPLGDTLTVEVNVLDDNVEFLSAVLDGRESTCSLVPAVGDEERPSFCIDGSCVDIGAVDVSEPLVELRRNAQGIASEATFHLVRFRYEIPTFPDETVLRLDIEAQNEVGIAARKEPVRIGLSLPTLVINEYQPRNVTAISLPRLLLDGTPDTSDANPFPDWFEIYNYGDEPIELSSFALVGSGSFRQLRGPEPGPLCDLNVFATIPPDFLTREENLAGVPPPCLFIWRFSLGFQLLTGGTDPEGAIAPGEHMLIVADGDEAPYNQYDQPGSGSRLFSVDFKLDGNNSDLLAIVDDCGVIVDMAEWDFSQEPVTGVVPADLAVGRLPDAAAAKEDVGPDASVCGAGVFSPGDGFLTPGCRLECPSPGDSNIAECEVAPSFSDIVSLNLRFVQRRLERCTSRNQSIEIRSYLYVDAETLAEDSFDDDEPDDPIAVQRYEVEIELEFTDPVSGTRVNEILTRLDDELSIDKDHTVCTFRPDPDNPGNLIKDTQFFPALDAFDACVNPERRAAVDLVRVVVNLPSHAQLQTSGLAGGSPILPGADGMFVRFFLRARDLRFVELLEAGLIDDPSLADWVTIDEGEFAQTSLSYTSNVDPPGVEIGPGNSFEHPAVVINELLTDNRDHLFGMYPDQIDNPDFDPPEFLELYNVDDEPVDISELYLANGHGTNGNILTSCDAAIDLVRRYDIPDGTVIPSQDYWLFLFVDEESADPVLDTDLAARTTLVRTDSPSESGRLRVTGAQGMVVLVASDDAANCVLDSRCWSQFRPTANSCDVDDEPLSCCLNPGENDSLGWRPDRDPRVSRYWRYVGDLAPSPGQPNCAYTPPVIASVTEPPACLSRQAPFFGTVTVYMAPHEFLRHANASDSINVQVTTEPDVFVGVTKPIIPQTLNPALPAPDDCQIPVTFQVTFNPLGNTPVVDFTVRVTDSAGGTDVTETISLVNCDVSTETTFIRGDVNNDTRVNISDMLMIFRELFFGFGGEPRCADAFDVDDDGDLTATDGFHLGDFLFLLGPRPAQPFPNPGTDPTTTDDLDCTR